MTDEQAKKAIDKVMTQLSSDLKGLLPKVGDSHIITELGIKDKVSGNLNYTRSKVEAVMLAHLTTFLWVNEE